MIVIMRPGHTGHNIIMTSLDEQGLAASGIPDPHRLIPTSGSEELAIG
jgi:hypothetical protein